MGADQLRLTIMEATPLHKDGNTSKKFVTVKQYIQIFRLKCNKFFGIFFNHIATSFADTNFVVLNSKA